jgi:hypothetical protein
LISINADARAREMICHRCNFCEEVVMNAPKLPTRWPMLMLAGAVLASAAPGRADEGERVTGFWQLVSYVVEVQATGQIEPVMGQHPTGYVYFSPEGRVMFILTGEGRKPAKTAEERANLLGTLVAYTGTYRIEGDRWITKVDVAWNPEWVGTEQARNFRIEGDRLQVLTPWRVMPNWPEKGMQRSIVTFERRK